MYAIYSSPSTCFLWIEIILAHCDCWSFNHLNFKKRVDIVQGELALAFGELLRKLWSSGRITIAPRAFKGKLARFAPQFSGYNQHDSQVGSATLLLCYFCQLILAIL